MSRYIISIGVIVMWISGVSAKNFTSNMIRMAPNYKPTAYSTKLLSLSGFSEDFESGATGWKAGHWGDLAPATWHLDAFQAYGGSGRSWWMGGVPAVNGYDNLWYQALTSPSITLPSAPCSLTFKMNRSVETPGANLPVMMVGMAAMFVFQQMVPHGQY